MDSRLRGNDSVEVLVFIAYDQCNNKIARYILFVLLRCPPSLDYGDARYDTK